MASDVFRLFLGLCVLDGRSSSFGASSGTSSCSPLVVQSSARLLVAILCPLSVVERWT